jgi:large subunit ribosomal protein L25
MAQAELTVSARNNVGKGAAHALRKQDQVPAVVYGKGMEPCSLIVNPKALKKAVATAAGWNTLITLKGDGPFNGKVVIVKDMQYDSIRRDIMHADFQAIDLKKKVHVMVPVHTTGKSQGEKDGGNLQIIRHELEVVCLPTAIPNVIEIDVTALKIGGVIHIDDIKLPAGAEVPHDVNFTVITVTGHKEEAAAEGSEAVASA